MNKIKIIEVSHDCYIPHQHGKLDIEKGSLVQIKVRKPRPIAIFSFLEPKIIMTVVIALLMLGVGSFAFFTLWDTLEQEEGMEVSDTECQTVLNPTIPQTVTIPDGATVSRVYERLNTGTTHTIDSGNWTVAGSTVTINVTG